MHAEDDGVTGHGNGGGGAMNALAEAVRMLGDIELSSGQLAQLRALNRKYAQRRYEGRGSEADLRALLRSGILRVTR
jgi:hypothetical protein